MTPLQARKPQNYGKVYFKLYGQRESPVRVKSLKIGDQVGISNIKERPLIRVILQIGQKKSS